MLDEQTVECIAVDDRKKTLMRLSERFTAHRAAAAFSSENSPTSAVPISARKQRNKPHGTVLKKVLRQR